MNEPEILRFYERQYGPFVHMSELDKSIWIRWLMQGGGQYAPFTYDVRVGNGMKLPANASEMEVKVRDALTTKRIDVLCVANSVVTIIEVKQRAGLSAIGQLIGYRDLYLAPQSRVFGLQMWLVTDELQPDMQGLLTENNIRYFEVGR